MKNVLINGIVILTLSILFFILSVSLIMNMDMFDIIYIIDFKLIKLDYFNFHFYMMIDYMSLMYLSLVFFISSMIYFYSIDYLSSDVYISRYNMLMLFFLISMSMMIMMPSILSILIGWDLLGISSYCLIIYYQNMIAYNSGMVTMICNRIGDISLMILISIMSSESNWNMMLYNNYNMLYFILLMMCSLSKSAQLPFSVWLPAAMSAPTPVSALVHSSTLVTAGVYILIRYKELFLFNNLNYYLIYIFVLTMFMSGLMGNFEYNLKKIVALSTLGQLSFMMMVLASGNMNLCFLHLIIHAFFKSLMFMSVGNFMHMNMNNQDLRFYGSFFYLNPFKSMIFLFSLLNLSGFMFISGFYSKEMILDYLFMSSIHLNNIMYLIIYLSTMLTLMYSYRIMLMVLFNSKCFMPYLFLGDNYFIYMNYVMLTMYFMNMLIGYYFMSMDFFYYYCSMSNFDKNIILKLYVFSLLISYYMNNNVYVMIKYKEYIYFVLSMFYLKMLYEISYMKLFKMIFMLEKLFEKYLELYLAFYMFFIKEAVYMILKFKKWNYKIMMMYIMKCYITMIMFMMYT